MNVVWSNVRFDIWIVVGTVNARKHHSLCTVTSERKGGKSLTLILRCTYNGCTCSVAEEHTCASVIPVHNLGQCLCTDNQRIFVHSLFDIGIRHLKGEQKSRTCGIYIKCDRFVCADRRLYLAGCGRCHMVCTYRSQNNQINILRAYPCVCKCQFCCLSRHGSGCFFRRQSSLTDSRTG